MDTVYKFDFVLIVGSVITLIVLVGYLEPMIIAPIDDYKTSQTEILFVIEKADSLLIDDNVDFTTPERYSLEEGLEIHLKPGKYFWKAEGVIGSEVRTLTINSEVNLALREVEGEGYGVVNIGNVGLDVDVYNGTELVDQVKLGVQEDSNIIGTKYVGGEA